MSGVVEQIRKQQLQVISPSEAAAMMTEIHKDKNPASRHAEADELMVKILRRLGYDDAMDVFESKERWYE